MRSILVTALVPLALFSGAAGSHYTPQGDSVIAFDVVRGGRPLGTHIVRFEQTGDQLRVITDVDLQVRIGPITVFNYEHDAVETWQDGTLSRFQSSTRKDGEDLDVDARLDGNTWQISGTDYSGDSLTNALPVSLALSSHWNGYDVSAGEIFNTETGEAMEVEFTDLGTETVTVMGDRIEAQRIRMEGTLAVDLWYGPNGEWLRCEFEARGETVEYIRVAA